MRRRTGYFAVNIESDSSLVDPIDELVGSRINARRKTMGLSLSAVATALNISFQQLQKYETGANRVSASRMFALAKILKVEPAHFFEPLDHDHQLSKKRKASTTDTDDIMHLSENDEGRRLNLAFQRIKSKALRLSIIEMVRNIVAGDEA